MHKFPTSKKRKSVSIEEAEIARRKQEYERQLQVKADLLEKEFMKMEQQKKLQESAAFSNEVNVSFLITFSAQTYANYPLVTALFGRASH